MKNILYSISDGFQTVCMVLALILLSLLLCLLRGLAIVIVPALMICAIVIPVNILSSNYKQQTLCESLQQKGVSVVFEEGDIINECIVLDQKSVEVNKETK